MYEPNPKRGCGFKQEDAFYAEGGDHGPGGQLWSWTWCVGDGIDDISPVTVPPRTLVACNPAASIVEGSLTRNPYDVPDWNEAIYEKLLEAMAGQGVADHVGDNHYSAYSFAQETISRGPSRRIPPNQAKAIGLYIYRHGPIPALYTHNRVPVFRSGVQRETARQFVEDLYNVKRNEFPNMVASWALDNWGMYARQNQNRCLEHYMIPVLRVINTLEHRWVSVQEHEVWKEARDFFGDLTYVEQTIGLSWICRVSYTLPKDREKISEVAQEIPGLFRIDLREKA